MKKLVALFLFINLYASLFADIKSVLILKTINADTNTSFYIMSQDQLICEGNQKENDTFNVIIKEPLPCFYIANNDTSKVFVFWIGKGILSINIDANNITNTTINNPLNNEYYENKRKEDSVYNLVYSAEVLSNPDFMLSKQDSLDAVLNHKNDKLYKQWYKKEAFKKTNSFLTLHYIKFHLKQYLLKQKSAAITKKQLWNLFKRIDAGMKDYPSYKRCVEMFSQKINKRPTINEPLMK
ncbi:MAG: hypothetical protein IT275_07130 [Chitinophagales bacterium]|nr:hypothetical protein [Chitinophagales bacterium]